MGGGRLSPGVGGGHEPGTGRGGVGPKGEQKNATDFRPVWGRRDRQCGSNGLPRVEGGGGTRTEQVKFLSDQPEKSLNRGKCQKKKRKATGLHRELGQIPVGNSEGGSNEKYQTGGKLKSQLETLGKKKKKYPSNAS